MSYNKKVWKSGDRITKEALNNMENGIEAAHQNSGGTGSAAIVDNLNSDSSTSALSAKQGKALNNKIPTKSIVEGGKLYLAKEDGTKLDSGTELPAGGSTIEVVNNLESDSTTAALSAAQGKALNTQYKDIAPTMNGITKTTAIEKPTPLVTFIDDDGGIGSYTHTFQVFKEKKEKFNCAISVNYLTDAKIGMNVEQVKEIIAAGNTISSHTLNHFNMGNSDMALIEKQCKESKEQLESMLNTKVNILTLPWGGLANSSYEGRKIMRKYYEAVISTTKGYNQKLNTFHIERQGLDNNLDRNKKYIDKVKECNGWLIFMSHGTQFTDTSTGDAAMQTLRDTIDYVKEQGIEIVTPEEGLSRKRNIIEVSNDPEKDGGFTVSIEGSVSFKNSDRINYLIDYKNLFENLSTGIKNDTTITNFPINSIQETTLTAFDGQTNFPMGHTGVLKTHRKSLVQFSYQIWQPSNSNYVFKRVCDNNGIWKDWVNITKIDNYHQMTSPSKGMQITNDTLPSKFDSNMITYTSIITAGRNFPHDGKSLLITNYVDSNSCFQLLIPTANDAFGDRHVYMRFSINEKGWYPWKDILGKNGHTCYDTPADEIVSTTKPSELIKGKVMYTAISDTSKTGFPEDKRGILLTNTISNTDIYNFYQEYVIRGEGKKYIRSAAGAEAWSEWKLL